MGPENRFLKAKRECFERLYSKLNNMQRQAVFCTSGPLLVLAGAGSGKTTVLVQRIAHIIRYGDAYHSGAIPETLCEEEVEYLEMMAKGECPIDGASLERYSENAVPAYAVLAITFTNKAAKSMKEKLEKQLSDKALDIWAGTFHSICAKILRREADKLGYDRSFAIYDTDDTKKLITECEKELEISTERFAPKAMQNIISKAKDKLIGAEEFAQEAGNDFVNGTVSKIYTLYEEKLKAANAMDFDDLIFNTVKIFAEFPDTLEYYQNKFRHILVDEYQDTNHAQFVLVRELAKKYRNIMAVGDDDQSIYSFRGATIDNILTFDKTFPDAKIIKLEQNYRSTGNILGAANSLISKNEGRYGKTLWCDAGDGSKAACVETNDQTAEARFIADTIADGVAGGERRFSDYAILYRMNAQSAGFETVFAKSGIPYRMLCGIRFYDRAEIKDMVAYMQLTANIKDDTRFMRIVNTPKRGIGDTTVGYLAKIAAAEGLSMFETARQADKYTALAKSAAKLSAFCDFIEKLQGYEKALPLGDFVEKIAEESGYFDMLYAMGQEGTEKVENVKELVNNAAVYQEENPDFGLGEFLEEVSLVADIDSYDTEANAVTMMTVHSAKGLEFNTVFLPGFEEGIFPGSLVISPKEVEEERRLAYVALTRARKELYICRARERMMYGRTNANPPSRFLREIDSRYKEEKSLVRRFSDSFSKPFSRPSENFGSPKRGAAQSPLYAKPAEKPKVISESFAVGDRVCHKVFGVGTVLSASDMGGDILYEVAFDGVGTKKLMATYAKLKKAD